MDPGCASTIEPVTASQKQWKPTACLPGSSIVSLCSNPGGLVLGYPRYARDFLKSRELAEELEQRDKQKNLEPGKEHEL